MTDEDAILAANAAYYQAFARGDFTTMCGIWAEADVSCVHPGWPVLIGRSAILESYRGILHNPDQEPIRHYKNVALISGAEGRVFCVETVGGMALAATNWFRRIDGAWRLIHHQASPIAIQSEADVRPPNRLN